MLDHIGFKVADFAKSRAFYTRVLATLGYGEVLDVTPEMTGTDTHHLGYGKDGNPTFWISTGNTPPTGLHVAFVAPNRAAIDAFHREALAAGATDNGGPGLRPHYHPTYYAAFVLDPDGVNIEAVCHAPE
ncbi:VOC family protein [Tahibacter amnicola]|uniref:VOC family protein n=1 Tax=Tahibacter amnicola TaxID=2976241 RepID=A0ABY6BFF4_9GAMM|nr:VOC family protein [Tahibacter amnicola]UXI67090.1 VOC family protein [Tahibacter amnicola]